MPGADFYRALATASFLRDELLHERDAHNAMKLCFEKIHKSLDMYQGHYINRLRFHLNRHHTEYLRKVRVMRREKHEKRVEEQTAVPSSSSRRSMRVGIAQELTHENEELKLQLRRRDLEIDRLTMLLDEKDIPVNTTAAAKPEKLSRRIEKLMNPYLPSSDDDIEGPPSSPTTVDPARPAK
jgi:hypothetical protein